METSNLATQLHDDAARAVPPFGADSVKIARDLGPKATNLLLQEIVARGKAAFLALEALRIADPSAYGALPAGERADIYIDALKNSIFFNAWGPPGHQLTLTAHALMALGDDAASALKPLLADSRPALLSGSKDATTSRIYGNRVCDYAWVFISEIKRRPYRYSQDPAERDQAIIRLRQEL